MCKLNWTYLAVVNRVIETEANNLTKIPITGRSDGARIGGLASALQLAHGGFAVTVLDRHATVTNAANINDGGHGERGADRLTRGSVFDDLVDVGAARRATSRSTDILARHFFGPMERRWTFRTILRTTARHRCWMHSARAGLICDLRGYRRGYCSIHSRGRSIRAATSLHEPR
jgi:hypothetical protein